MNRRFAAALPLFLVLCLCPAMYAQRPDCTNFQGSTSWTDYPVNGFLMSCVNLDSQPGAAALSAVWNAAGSATTNYLKQLFTARHVRLYVFTNLYDFNWYFDTDLELPNRDESVGLTPDSEDLPSLLLPMSALFQQCTNCNSSWLLLAVADGEVTECRWHSRQHPGKAPSGYGADHNRQPRYCAHCG
jgi:hypothetical protein